MVAAIIHWMTLNFSPWMAFLTLMAFKVFVEEKVDLAVIEVGMGGLYDATNIMEKPAVCGITSLALEHTSTLGNTLAEIATQKAGILKPGVPAFVVPQKAEAMATVAECALAVGAPLKLVPDYKLYHCPSASQGGTATSTTTASGDAAQAAGGTTTAQAQTAKGP